MTRITFLIVFLSLPMICNAGSNYRPGIAELQSDLREEINDLEELAAELRSNSANSTVSVGSVPSADQRLHRIDVAIAVLTYIETAGTLYAGTFIHPSAPVVYETSKAIGFTAQYWATGSPYAEEQMNKSLTKAMLGVAAMRGVDAGSVYAEIASSYLTVKELEEVTGNALR